MANSTAQTVPLTEVYDYVLATGDPASATTAKGLSGKKVKITLQYDRALTVSPDPVVWVPSQTVYTAITDLNGFWHVFLVPNNKISPANTYYTVEVEGQLNYQIQVTDVGVPAPGWQSSASGILLNIPAALAPTTSTVGAITATGLITAQAGINVSAGGATIAGGLTVSGGETETGGLTVDTLSYSSAVSRLIPGATSFSVRDNANANDNLLVTNAGNVTVRGSLTVTTGPLTVTAGGLTVSAGGATITGNSTVTGTLTVTAAFTVGAGGAAITGNSTVTGTLTVTSTLILSAAASQIVPGATSLALTNNANNANNLLMTDAGLATFRNAVTIPPSAGGTVPTSGYGTVPVKIDDQLLGATSSRITFVNPLPTGFRHLLVEWYARTDNAVSAQPIAMQLNNVATATYDWEEMFCSGTVQGTPIETLADTSMRIGAVPGASATANYFGSGEAKVRHYNGAVGNKVVQASSSWSTADTTTNTLVGHFTGKWRTTATAVTRVDVIAVAGNFIAGSLFTLWGIP